MVKVGKTQQRGSERLYLTVTLVEQGTRKGENKGDVWGGKCVLTTLCQSFFITVLMLCKLFTIINIYYDRQQETNWGLCFIEKCTFLNVHFSICFGMRCDVKLALGIINSSCSIWLMKAGEYLCPIEF